MNAPSAETVYRSPVYYDVAYSWDPADEVALYLGCFRTYGAWPRPRSLYEPGSGTGRLAVAFARQGIRVTGLDRSEEMNRYATGRAESEGVSALVRFEAGRMEFVPTGEAAEGAFCALSTIRYLTEEDGIISHLRTLGARLRPGAVYALDTRFGEDTPRTPTREFWELERGGICTLTRWQMEVAGPSPAVGTETLSIEVEEHGKKFTLTERNPTRLDSRESFERLVAASGLFEIAAYLGPERDPAKPRLPEQVQGRAVAVLRRTK